MIKYDEKYWLKGLKRNKRYYKFFKFVLSPYYRRKYNAEIQEYSISNAPTLILSNHYTNDDPMLTGMAFKEYIRFVSTEKLLRSKPFGKLIVYLQKPIPRKKGAVADDTVEYIKTNLKLGINVAMYATGVRTYNGETGFISSNTGKLVKETNANLITFSFDGGYFSSPLWAKHKRKGKLSGKVVNEYSKEFLQKLSIEEINDIIKKDLLKNDYDIQQKQMIKYYGKNLAENLEISLFLCPKCFSIGKLVSQKEKLYCTCCHNTVTIDEYGYFDNNSVFSTVYDWDVYQRQYVFDNIERIKKDKILIDSNITLNKVVNEKTVNITKEADLFFDCDKFTIISGNVNINYYINDIVFMSNNKNNCVLFSLQDGSYFEIFKKDFIKLRLVFSIFYSAKNKKYI